MSDLYIHHHLGLGDMIHCNGMVRRLLKSGEFDKVYVFCKKCHSKSVDWMYRDDDRIELIIIDESGDERQQVDNILSKRILGTDNKFLRVGHEFYKEHGNEIGPMPCDMLFYEQIGLPYSVRFDDCYWERDLEEEERVYKKLVPEGTDYIFVHDDPNRTEVSGGFVISEKTLDSDLHIIKNDMSESIFHFGKMLENAKEVHCMESSIRCMIEFLKPKLIENKVKLYMHSFRGGPFYNDELDIWNGTNLPWTIVRPKE